MFKVLIGLAVLFVVLFATTPVAARSCPGSSSVCNSFFRADLVFAGRAVSVEPNVDPWDASVRSRFTARFPEQEIEQLETDTSVETFRKLREVYGELLPEPA